MNRQGVTDGIPSDADAIALANAIPATRAQAQALLEEFDSVSLWSAVDKMATVRGRKTIDNPLAYLRTLAAAERSNRAGAAERETRYKARVARDIAERGREADAAQAEIDREDALLASVPVELWDKLVDEVMLEVPSFLVKTVRAKGWSSPFIREALLARAAALPTGKNLALDRHKPGG
jgi:hypothetical protein